MNKLDRRLCEKLDKNGSFDYNGEERTDEDRLKRMQYRLNELVEAWVSVLVFIGIIGWAWYKNWWGVFDGKSFNLTRWDLLHYGLSFIVWIGLWCFGVWLLNFMTTEPAKPDDDTDSTY